MTCNCAHIMFCCSCVWTGDEETRECRCAHRKRRDSQMCRNWSNLGGIFLRFSCCNNNNNSRRNFRYPIPVWHHHWPYRKIWLDYLIYWTRTRWTIQLQGICRQNVFHICTSYHIQRWDFVVVSSLISLFLVWFYI